MNRYSKMFKVFKIVFPVSVRCSVSRAVFSMPLQSQVLYLFHPEQAAEVAASLTDPVTCIKVGALRRLISQESMPRSRQEKGDDMVGSQNIQAAAHFIQEIITLTFGFGNSPVLLPAASVPHLFQSLRWHTPLNLPLATLLGC